MTDQDAQALYSVLKRLWDDRFSEYSDVIYMKPETVEAVKDILEELEEDFEEAKNPNAVS